VHGLISGVSTGESYAETVEERLKIARFFLAEVKGLIPVFIGTGGDVKMLPAVMLFVPGDDIVLFLQIFSMALGAVSLGALVFQRIAFFRRLGWESAVAPRHVPVGLAISVAVIGLAGVRLLAP
jgi:hypothetical protein